MSACPDGTALTLGDESRTFSEVKWRAKQLSNVLSSLGVVRGDRVAWWSDVDIDAASLQFGIGRLGAVVVPLNPAYSDDETRQVLEYVEPRLFLCDRERGDRGDTLAKELDLPYAVTRGPGRLSLDDLLLSASAVEPGCPMPNAEDVFVIFLTSGSTGVPKGVMISHRATWLRAFAGSLASSTTGGGGALVAFPLFHMAGWFFAYQAWSAHQPAHLVRRADGRHLLETVERHRPASLYCIPAVWQRVVAEEGTYDTSSLEWTFTGTSRVARRSFNRSGSGSRPLE